MDGQFLARTRLGRSAAAHQLAGAHQVGGHVAQLAVVGLARLDQDAEGFIRGDLVSFDEDA